jgi:small GTP-binding protein
MMPRNRPDPNDDDSQEMETKEAPAVGQPRPTTAFKQLLKLTGHRATINRIAWSPDDRWLASTSYDKTIKLWDWTNKNQTPMSLEGHRDWVSSVAFSPDGRYLASASGDNQVRIWNVETGETVKAFTAHSRAIFSIAWSPDGKVIATGSSDRSIAFWNTANLKLIDLLQEFSGAVYAIAWSPDGSELASACADQAVRVTDRATGKLKRIYEGHAGPVYSVAYSPDGRVIASASQDTTVRLWGRQTGILEGHTDIATSISFSSDGHFLASKSLDGSVRLWRSDTWETVKIIAELASSYWTSGLAFHPKWPVLATMGDEDQALRIWRFDSNTLGGATPVIPSVRYTNAKVVLVGESGVGKTSLANALMGKSPQATYSTHGRRVKRFITQEIVLGKGINEIREIFLWDLAGQSSYRVIHQLHLNEVVVAVVVFNAHNETDPFAGVRHWNRALRHAQSIQGKGQLPLTTFLVAGRVDRGGVGVGRARIDKALEELGFDDYFETSATEGWGVAELHAAIVKAIDWDALPKVNSTVLFQKIKNFLARVRDKGREDGQLLYRIDDLYDTFIHNSSGQTDILAEDLRAQFETCISLVEARGLIRRFSFGNLVLLQPELLDAYASAMISAAKDESDGMGNMAEEDARHGRFRMSDGERIADKTQEELLLISTVEDLLRHEIALRDEDNGVVTLIFPSQSTRTYPNIPDPDNHTIMFEFEGPVVNIYATLAVRLWHTGLFASKELYENAVFFTSDQGSHCRMFLVPFPEEGKAEMRFFFDEDFPKDKRQHVEEYVNTHLMRRALPDTVKRKRPFICPKCKTPVTELQARKRIEMGKNDIICNVCETRVLLTDMTVSTKQTFLRQVMVQKLDREADTQRERQMALAILQGKIATGDFDVFLCHNNKDKPIVERIGDQLKEHGILPWLDVSELTPGDTWQQLLAEYIEKCKVFAFFLGSNGTGPWQNKELTYVLELDKDKRIIPVLLPDSPKVVKRPISLVDRQWVDFRRDSPDPVAQLVKGILGKKQIEPG